jgi:hypothetical protein
VPLIAARLSPVKILEQSEEIRLAMVKVINVLVKRCGVGFAPFVQDVIAILSRATIDSFQDIRKVWTGY